MRFIQGDNFNTIYNVVQPQMKTPLNPQQPKTIEQTTCSTKGTRKDNFQFKYYGACKTQQQQQPQQQQQQTLRSSLVSLKTKINKTNLLNNNNHIHSLTLNNNTTINGC